MGQSSERAADRIQDDLFDKYTLPKAALAIILVASLVGTALTSRLAGVGSVAVIAAKWGYFVTLGVLTGGLLWKHAFVRPDDLDDEVAAYCAQMFSRFDDLAVGLVTVLLVTGFVVVLQYSAQLQRGALVGVLAVLLGGLLVLVGVTSGWSPGVESHRRWPDLLALGLSLAVVVLTAVVEVRLRGGSIVASGVRVLHLLAFAVWLGGAVWNIFIAVPTGQQYTTTPVIQAAGEQLERFRWAVRVIIPTLLVTGLYQSVDVFGYQLTTYTGTVLGLAVVGKLALIGVLVAIFKLCPMWRACSPVDGVCELDDLAQQRTDSSTEGPADD